MVLLLATHMSQFLVVLCKEVRETMMKLDHKDKIDI